MSIDGVLSDLLEILIGVPQGSILGPILFLIYVNDLPEWSNLLALLFADDTTLLASDDNIDDLILHVRSEFKKIVKRATEEEKNSRDLWNEWYNGTGLNGWWD